MSNTKATYQSQIREQSGVPLDDTEQVVKEQQKLEQDSISRTLKIQWLQDAQTSYMFTKINIEIEELEQQARNLAVNENNKDEAIIKLLVRSAELRKLKETYGR